jgi:hypothetical protein
MRKKSLLMSYNMMIGYLRPFYNGVFSIVSKHDFGPVFFCSRQYTGKIAVLPGGGGLVVYGQLRSQK